MTPRVSQLQELDLLALVVELMDRDERVGMTRDYPTAAFHVFVVVAGCHHSEVSLVSLVQHIEEAFDILDLVVLYAL